MSDSIEHKADLRETAASIFELASAMDRLVVRAAELGIPASATFALDAFCQPSPGFRQPHYAPGALLILHARWSTGQ